MNMLLRWIAAVAVLIPHADGYVSPSQGLLQPPHRGHGPGEKKVAVLGTAGYSGALAFGFLKRVANQYGTGIDEVASLGATMESGTHLNHVLEKSFQSFINDDDEALLSTNLFSVDAIAESLKGCHAVVMGTDIGVAVREVTPGTFKTLNGVTCEVYWPAARNLDAVPANYPELRLLIINNILDAARIAGIEHICLVDDAKDYGVLKDVHATGIPYTCLGPTAIQMINHVDYTYKLGVLDRIEAVELRENEEVPISRYLHREDMVLLAIQTLISVDWTRSRCLAITSLGRAESTWMIHRSDDTANNAAINKEWCHNAYLLKEALGQKSFAFVY
mmetsp:Transcript_9434/g.18045  ORF Transcript_9434/g.18045 Transcript_9434/m.18045 type:complete len:333 (-) Transcript_9434:157-1155(-)|eukprot:scaffold4223_cov189-Amphora_coffeaeformis.AAC.34